MAGHWEACRLTPRACCGQAGSTFTVPVAHAACERDLTGNPYLHLFHAMLRV